MRVVSASTQVRPSCPRAHCSSALQRLGGVAVRRGRTRRARSRPAPRRCRPAGPVKPAAPITRAVAAADDLVGAEGPEIAPVLGRGHDEAGGHERAVVGVAGRPRAVAAAAAVDERDRLLDPELHEQQPAGDDVVGHAPTLPRTRVGNEGLDESANVELPRRRADDVPACDSSACGPGASPRPPSASRRRPRRGGARARARRRRSARGRGRGRLHRGRARPGGSSPPASSRGCAARTTAPAR